MIRGKGFARILVDWLADDVFRLGGKLTEQRRSALAYQIRLHLEAGADPAQVQRAVDRFAAADRFPEASALIGAVRSVPTRRPFQPSERRVAPEDLVRSELAKARAALIREEDPS